MSDCPIRFHWALNKARFGGVLRYDSVGGPITVERLGPHLPWMASGRSRKPAPGWRARVHALRERWVADDGREMHEQGIGLCGTHLIDPVYLAAPRVPEREASPCPRCCARLDPEGLATALGIAV